jgi:hypothetical protein
MNNNILSQLKPYGKSHENLFEYKFAGIKREQCENDSKILGKGSEGVIILSHDKKYTVKIYLSNYLKSLMFFNIINYLQDIKLPKTVYKSYLFTQKKNSLERYLSNNSLPNHFSYKNNNNLQLLSSQYKMTKKLYEIMKTYDMSLEDFIEKIKLKNIDNQIKINILYSLFQQGLVTLFWLYITKGIIHSDINSNNFFVQKTKKDKLVININGIIYNVKLFGYYLVIGDFGYAKSIELISFDKNPDKASLTILSDVFNPLFDITNFIKLFKIKFLDYDIHNIKINNYILSIEDDDYNMRNAYKSMLKSYISNNNDLQNNIEIFKKLFNDYMYKYIFSKF